MVAERRWCRIDHDQRAANGQDLRMESDPPATVPRVRGTVIHGYRMAALELWGEDGLRRIAEDLPPATRQRTVDELLVTVDRVPVRDVMEWQQAIWQGPAERREESFHRFIDRSVDHGFGRIRRAFLKLATPAQVAAKAPAMWAHQHTHGRLDVALRTGTNGVVYGAVVTLRDSPLLESAVSRRAVVEGWRYIATLARVKGVRATHQMDGDALVARLSWGAEDA
jgi:hypothetical protein